MKRSIEREFKTGKTVTRIEKPGRPAYEGSCGSHDGTQLYRYPVEDGDVIYLETYNKEGDFTTVQQNFTVQFCTK